MSGKTCGVEEQTLYNNLNQIISLLLFCFMFNNFLIRHLNALQPNEMASIWQPDIFYPSKEPQDPAVETIIDPGRLDQKSTEPQDPAVETIR